jgi:hypothetical protein
MRGHLQRAVRLFNEVFDVTVIRNIFLISCPHCCVMRENDRGDLLVRLFPKTAGRFLN